MGCPDKLPVVEKIQQREEVFFCQIDFVFCIFAAWKRVDEFDITSVGFFYSRGEL
jgi:hypothetical protein